MVVKTQPPVKAPCRLHNKAHRNYREKMDSSGGLRGVDFGFGGLQTFIVEYEKLPSEP